MNKFRIKLQTKSILNAPFQQYDKDFTFIINGKKIRTSKFAADILSPKIAKMHVNDPTLNEFIIRTQCNGNPSYLLNLINFEYNEIPASEAPFLSEVIEKLGNESIKVFEENKKSSISLDNVFDLIKRHDLFQIYYANDLKQDIDFISEHFFEIKDEPEGLQNLSLSTLQRIFDNPNLQLNSEDQLINCINFIYSKNPEYSSLYEYVEFTNVSPANIQKFLQLFNIDDITKDTWKALSRRLGMQIVLTKNRAKEINQSERYNIHKGVSISYDDNSIFKGIINYLKENSKDGLEKEINITSSSVFSKSYDPRNVLIYNDKSKRFLSDDIENSWICIDFKKHRIIPTNYSIKSFELNQNSAHPKSWVIEASNDNQNWDLIDEKNNCPALNGRNFIHTFKIKNQVHNKYRYIRLRQTKPNCAESNYLMISCIEFYGTLI